MIKSLVHPDPTCVTFKSCEGKSIEINKYFLFLYDAFYRSILDENIEEGLVFIFDGASYEELIVLRDNILQKHLQCIDHTQISNQKMDIEDCKITSDPSQHTSNNAPENRYQDHENRNVDDDLILECPFKCEDVPDSKWTPDLLFAHVFSKHDDDVKNNFYVSIDTFIDRLSSRLSSTNCAFKCEKSRHVYDDITALKNHYHRCHVEDPVICPHCGESLMNSLIYVAHINRSCNVRVRRKCNLCDGKTIKNLTYHMKTVHGERKVVCDVDGCSLKFVGQFDLIKHTRAVHKKEKPFVCDKCGTKMAQFANLKDHRIKVHREGNITFKEFKEMIRAGQHQFFSKETEIPSYM